eukprot:847956-Pyramimonas_sp.AAC.1
MAILASGSDQTLIKVAAMNAFRRLKFASVVQFSEAAGHPVDDDANLCEALHQGIMGIMGCNATDAMKYVKKRLAANDMMTRLAGNIMDVDEALACLDRNDAQLLQKDQKDHADMISEQAEFERACKTKAWDVKAMAKPKAKPTAKAK